MLPSSLPVITRRKGKVAGLLSPLLAEFYLLELDQAFEHIPNIYYQRFCDDIIVLTKTKCQQKRAIRKIKQVLNRLKLTIRYRKTFTGKTSDILVYLGYKIYPNRTIGISSESIKRMKLNLLRLYEQGSSPERIRSYIRRWQGAYADFNINNRILHQNI